MELEHQKIIFKIRGIIRLLRKQGDINKKMIRLLKEMITLSNVHFELESLTKDLKTLRI